MISFSVVAASQTPGRGWSVDSSPNRSLSPLSKRINEEKFHYREELLTTK